MNQDRVCVTCGRIFSANVTRCPWDGGRLGTRLVETIQSRRAYTPTAAPMRQHHQAIAPSGILTAIAAGTLLLLANWLVYQGIQPIHDAQAAMQTSDTGTTERPLVNLFKND